MIDELRQTLAPQSSLDLASPAFSLFAFAELREVLENLDTCRMVLPEANGADLGLTGSDNDRAFGIGFKSAGSPKYVLHGSRRRWSCERPLPCSRSRSSLPASRNLNFTGSLPATALSRRRVWASRPATSSA